MRRKHLVLMCDDFLKNLRIQRLGVYHCFMKTSDKHVVENIAQGNATKTENEPISIENVYLNKNTMSQRHGNYRGFVKSRVAPKYVKVKTGGSFY